MADTLAISVGKELGFAIDRAGITVSNTAIDNTARIEAIINRTLGTGRGGTIVIERADEGESGNVVDFTARRVARDVESYARRHGIYVVKFSEAEWTRLVASPEGEDGFEDDALTLVRDLDFKPQSANEANAICMLWAYEEIMSRMNGHGCRRQNYLPGKRQSILTTVIGNGADILNHRP